MLRRVLCGRCAECGERNPTEFHHVMAHLKKENFGDCRTVGSIKKELTRSTVDGVIYVRALCAECHHSITWRGGGEVTGETAAKKEFVTKFKCSNGGQCMYEQCIQPDYICTPTNVSSFDLDHLHPAACTCAVCSADETLRKAECVSRMVSGKWGLPDVERECREGVVRLVHRECHLLITAEQWRANMWANRAEVQVAVDAVEVDEEEEEVERAMEEGELEGSAEDEEDEMDEENEEDEWQPAGRKRRVLA